MTSKPPDQFQENLLDYYENNTRWFKFFGATYRSPTIHRAVWAEGITDRPSALSYIDEQISADILAYQTEKNLAQVKVLDLGCGVGGSLLKITENLGQAITAIGLTLSPRQAQIAQQWSNRLGMQSQCAFLAADFHAVPLHLGVDLAFSIEAFAHAGKPETYFAEAARLLKSGGRLILCDDFLASPLPPNGTLLVARRWLQLFKSGWRIPHLLSLGQTTGLAQEQGLHLTGTRDLSRYIRKRVFPKALIPILELLLSQGESLHPLFGSIIGGLALEHCIGNRLVTYNYLVLEKQT
jgi:SAM-dependent methyltransferase